MNELEAMLYRIGNEQEANGGQPFAFMCADAESSLVERLLARDLVSQTWRGRGPSIVRLLDGFTQFLAIHLTNGGDDLYNALRRKHGNP